MRGGKCGVRAKVWNSTNCSSKRLNVRGYFKDLNVDGDNLVPQVGFEPTTLVFE
jgi:hypothetical protein